MSETRMGAAADPQAIAEGQQRRRIQLRREQDDARAVLATKEGRRFVWTWLSKAGAFQRVGGPCDADRANWMLARRELGLEMIDHVAAASPQDYLLMESEAREQARQESA